MVAYKITQDCLGCGTCQSNCPQDAIRDGEVMYIIDPVKCNECVGYFQLPKCAEVCPVGACISDGDKVKKL